MRGRLAYRLVMFPADFSRRSLLGMPRACWHAACYVGMCSEYPATCERFRSFTAPEQHRLHVVDYLSELANRITSLRAKIAGLLEEFGEIAPSMRQIHDELAQMESQLRAVTDEGIEPD